FVSEAGTEMSTGGVTGPTDEGATDVERRIWPRGGRAATDRRPRRPGQGGARPALSPDGGRPRDLATGVGRCRRPLLPTVQERVGGEAQGRHRGAGPLPRIPDRDRGRQPSRRRGPGGGHERTSRPPRRPL